MDLLVYNPSIYAHTKTLARQPTYIYGDWHAPTNQDISPNAYIGANTSLLRTYLRRYNLKHHEVQCLLHS